MYSGYTALLFLGIVLPSHCEVVVVKLANGGTSMPMLLRPIGYEGTKESLTKDTETIPAPEALYWPSSHQNKDASFMSTESSSSNAPDSLNISSTNTHNTSSDSDINANKNIPVGHSQQNTNLSHSPKTDNDNSSEENLRKEQSSKTRSLKQEASINLTQKSEGKSQVNPMESTEDNLDIEHGRDQAREIPQKSNATGTPEDPLNAQPTSTVQESDARGTREVNESDVIPPASKDSLPSPTSTTIKPTGEVIISSLPTTFKSTSKATTKEEIPIKTTTSTPVPSSTTNILPQVPTCHQSCLAALNATRLYSNQSLTLSQGSDLTLIFELPLDTTFVLENMIWLFHPDNSPTGQCSLTTQEFIHSCEGFQAIKNTDDRNTTFLRETITLVNMLSNYTGQYISQVQVTCCPQSQEHTMNEERTSHVTVQVWTESYTMDLVVAGSVAVVLLLVLVGVTYYQSRLEHDDYITVEDQIKEIKPSTVLHMPLIDDGDNDSFDSNFDEQD